VGLLAACTAVSYSTYIYPCSAGGPVSSLDPTASVTTYATNSISQLYPIVLAVAGALVGVLVLAWGVNAVLHILHPVPDEVVSDGDFSAPDDLEDQLGSGFASVNRGWVDGSESFS
jgi:hypothetical protein